jgi:proton-translocating NADH-quinone oxidoreductase chain M
MLALPLLAIIHLIVSPKWSKETLWKIALGWSLIIFSLFIYTLNVTPISPQFQHIYSLSWIQIDNAYLKWGDILLGLDGVSFFLVGLSALLIPICILVSWKSINHMNKEFLISLFVIIFLLIGVFTILDVLGFYILFEGILIPMFIIIGVWGSREQKVKAAFYFFFYTLIGSLLMLISIFKIYSIYGTTNYLTLITCEIPASLQIWLFLGFFASLAAKIPMIPFHIWLPQAHVEAPIAGSVLLAGILLKLGGYGFLRFAYPLFPIASEFFCPFIMLMSIIALIYASLTTLRQTDVKRLIAYSSVAHMGLVTLAIFAHSHEGVIASLIMMLAHGLASSGLFMSSVLLYTRHHTRIIKYYRGLVVSMPVFSTVTLILILANIGFPLTFNFIAEFISILVAFNYSYLVGILACSGALLSTVYALYFYNRISFGLLSPHLKGVRDIDSFEFQSLTPIIIFTIVLGVFPNLIINTLNSGAYNNISL